MPPSMLYRSEAFAEDLIDLPAPLPAPARRRSWALAAWPALVAALGGYSLIAFGLPI